MRALVQYTDADFHNPISQFIHRATSGPIRILRRVVPRVAGADVGSPLVLALLVALVDRSMFIKSLGFDILGSVPALLVLAPVKVLDYVIIIFIVAVLVRIVLSWIAPGINQFSRLVVTFTEPIMSPARRLIPTLGALDFSPILVLFFLNLADIFVVRFLESLGEQMLR